MYKPKHFVLQEWLPELFYEKLFPVYGVNLWRIFDERILMFFDHIRQRYNSSIIMNTWHSRRMRELYGHHQWRGYRDGSSPYVQRRGNEPYGNMSQHRFGRAGDGVPIGISAEEIRQDILDHPYDEDWRDITCLEADVGWLHADVRNHDKDSHGIKIVHK